MRDDDKRIKAHLDRHGAKERGDYDEQNRQQGRTEHFQVPDSEYQGVCPAASTEEPRKTKRMPIGVLHPHA